MGERIDELVLLAQSHLNCCWIIGFHENPDWRVSVEVQSAQRLLFVSFDVKGQEIDVRETIVIEQIA